MNPIHYAAQTSVDVAKSQQQIEGLLKQAGATGYGRMWHENRHMITFALEGRTIRIEVPVLSIKPRMTTKQIEQAERTLWRELYFLLKAKLVAITVGARTFEDEFVADTVMPNGQTVSQWAKPQIRFMIDEGKMPPLLPGGKD